MNPNDQITYLTSEKDKKQEEIRDKERRIELLKEGIKLDKKMLKVIEEGIAVYTKQCKSQQ